MFFCITPALTRARAAVLTLLLLCAFSPQALACAATGNVSSDLGPYSPPAIKAGAVPALRTQAGLTCVPSVIVLLGMNYIKARFSSQNGLKLKKTGGTATIDYAASADPDGTVPFAQNATVDYMQNNLLNLLGLLGGSSAELPLFVKPSSAALPAEGTYTDRITIRWDWYLCQGIGALFLCVGTPNAGVETITIDVTLTVAANNITVATSSKSTWDPINGALFPKSLPSGRQRMTLTVANPDIVPIQSNTVVLTVPITSRQRLALEGDGSGSPAVFTYSDGSPASTLGFAFATPGSTVDDVDFSSDGGATWAYVPVAGNAASQAAVNAIRLRPRGIMAPRSSFSISLPLATR